MAGGCINIYTSRRTNFDKVWYWKRNDAIKDLSEYVYNQNPDGMFYAKDVSVESQDNQQVNNAFMFDSSSITLYTEDTVNIEINDIVKYEDTIWRVNNVQYQHIHKNHQFMKKGYNRTYIQITK